MLSKRILITVACVTGFLIFISSTNPHEITLLAILFPFILIGIAFYNLITIVFERLFAPAKKNKLRIYSLIGTVMLVNFALLSSIGQLTVQDSILALLITAVGGAYLYKFQIS